MAAALHAAPGEEHLVEDQSREGALPDRHGTNETGRTRTDRTGETRWPLGISVRLPAECHRRPAISESVEQESAREGVLQNDQRRKQVRDTLANSNRQEGRDQSKAHSDFYRDAGERKDPALDNFACRTRSRLSFA